MSYKKVNSMKAPNQQRYLVIIVVNSGSLKGLRRLNSMNVN